MLGIDKETTKLQLSYMAVLYDWEGPIYIQDDHGVLGYLTSHKDQCRSLLHVELVDGQNVLDAESRACYSVRQVIGVDDEGDEGVIGVDDDDEGVIGVDDEPDAKGNDEKVGLDEGEPSGDLDGVPSTHTESGVSVSGEWDDGLDIVLHQHFESKEDVYELIQTGSHKNCFEFLVIKSDRQRFVVKCREHKNGCKWALRVAAPKDSCYFSVRTYYSKHSCSRASISTSINRRKGTTRIVAGVVRTTFRGEHKTPAPKSLIGMVQTQVGVKVSYSTAWRGKRMAANYVRGSPRESYGMLYSYLFTLEEMNPGTVSYVLLDDEKRFKYMFFALGASIEGFKVMRKVLIIDATHIKTAEGGVLMVVTAQDGNHHHYPIAFGVLDGESDPSWGWFLNALKTVVPDMPDLVFISDRNQSLINAVEKVFPLAKHGFCNFHLAQNVKTNCTYTSKKALVAKFLECSKAYTEGEFLTLYDAFTKRYPAAAAYLQRTVDQDRWARCYFPGDRYNIDTSNAVESINAVLLDARRLSLLPMIDAIVKKVAEWFCKHRKSSEDLLGAQKLVPFVDIEIHNRCAEANTLTVSDLNHYYRKYSVLGNDDHTYLVDLKMKSCTCKRFDIDKYPCVHAIAAAMKAGIALDTLCSKYYLVELWAVAYNETIYPVPHSSEWVVPDNISSMYALPPDYVKRRGRIKTTRILSTGEYGSRKRRASRLGRWFDPHPPVSQQ